MPAPDPCIPGYFCPAQGNSGSSSGSTSTGGGGGINASSSNTPLPCPPFTYNAQTAAASVSACALCPPGTLCNASGVSDPSRFPCPAAHYCVQGAQSPTPCPPGTYSDTLWGASVDDCAPCPGGYFCSDPATVAPVPCEGGTVCPLRSAIAAICPPGWSCPPRSAQPLLCPPTLYCPAGSDTGTPCSAGAACPPGSIQPIVCPPGSWSPAHTALSDRASLNTACERCPPGSYSADGSNGTACAPCPPGYVCTGGTSSATPISSGIDGGYMAPPGSYAPTGSVMEVLCPAGTYNSIAGAASSSQCLPCANGTYSAEGGAPACLPCPASASSSTPFGALACSCIGAFRSFQPSDGHCVCAPGYAFFDAISGALDSGGDGAGACAPITYGWCAPGYTRVASGACVAAAGACDATCGGGGGSSIDPHTGLCICGALASVDVDALCNATCLAGAPTARVVPLGGAGGGSSGGGVFAVTVYVPGGSGMYVPGGSGTNTADATNSANSSSGGSATSATVALSDITGFMGDVHCSTSGGGGGDAAASCGCATLALSASGQFTGGWKVLAVRTILSLCKR